MSEIVDSTPRRAAPRDAAPGAPPPLAFGARLALWSGRWSPAA